MITIRDSSVQTGETQSSRSTSKPQLDGKSSAGFFEAVVSIKHADVDQNTPSQTSETGNIIVDLKDILSTDSGKKRSIMEKESPNLDLPSSARKSSNKVESIDILPNKAFPSPGMSGTSSISDKKRRTPSSAASTGKLPSSSSKSVVDNDLDETELNDISAIGGPNFNSNSDFYSLQDSDDEEWSEDDRYKRIKPAIVLPASKGNKLRRLID